MEFFEVEKSSEILSGLLYSIEAKVSRVKRLVARRPDNDLLEFIRYQLDSQVYQKAEHLLMELQNRLETIEVLPHASSKLDLSKFYEVEPIDSFNWMHKQENSSFCSNENHLKMKKLQVDSFENSPGRPSVDSKAHHSANSSYTMRNTPEKQLFNHKAHIFKTAHPESLSKKHYSVLSNKTSRFTDMHTDTLISDLKRDLKLKCSMVETKHNPRKVLANTLFGKSIGGAYKPKSPIISYMNASDSTRCLPERNLTNLPTSSLLNTYRTTKNDLHNRNIKDDIEAIEVCRKNPNRSQEVIIEASKKKQYCFKALDSSTSGSKWQSLFTGAHFGASLVSPAHHNDKRQDKRRTHVGLFGQCQAGAIKDRSANKYQPKSYYQTSRAKLSKSSEIGTERTYSRSKSNTASKNPVLNSKGALKSTALGYDSFLRTSALVNVSADRSSDMLKLKYELLIKGSNISRKHMASTASGKFLNLDMSPERVK